jgi:hypothetical protein
MTDSTEYVEITYKLKFTTRVARKDGYPGLTDQTIIEDAQDPGMICQTIVEHLSFVDDITQLDKLKAKVKFISDLDEELEEE